jgi:hypothetical protein
MKGRGSFAFLREERLGELLLSLPKKKKSHKPQVLKMS